MAVPTEIAAFVVVIESSSSVASEAKYFLRQCLPAILTRVCNARNKSIMPKLGVVTYGASDSLPTPILFRRTFAESPDVFKVISPEFLNPGMINAPGPRGMSALEGLVAALELFHDYDNAMTNANMSKYIIHFASSDPDAFVNPVWNSIPELDDLTWDSLPDQFKERRINYNLLTTRNKPETLAHLYAKALEGKATPPWFPVHHSILLAGIPAIPESAPVAAPTTPATITAPTPAPQTVTKPTPKRPNDAAPEQPRQDPKRPRISDSPVQAAAKPTPTTTKTATPRVAPAAVPTPSPSMPTPTQVPASVPVPPAPQAVPPPPPPNALAVVASLKSLEDVRRLGAQFQMIVGQCENSMKAAEARGDMEVFRQASRNFSAYKNLITALRVKLQAMPGGPPMQGQQPQRPTSQQLTGPQHNPGMAGPSSSSGFQPNTPENHPAGPQFGSPNMPAANITMNQASTSMNPMVSAQHRAHAQQLQIAQARAQQGQGTTAGQGGAGLPRMGMPSGQSQSQATKSDMERQYQQVLDWERKINQKGDANNRPIPTHTAPPLPRFPLPQDLANAIASSKDPASINPKQAVNKFQDMLAAVQPANQQVELALVLAQLRDDAMAEVIKKGVRERPTFLNFVDNQRPGGIQSVWKGTLTWPAYCIGEGVKEVSMQVHALHHDPASCHVNTWPPGLLLQLAPKPADMAGQISAWLNKHQPVVCLIDIPNDTPEPQQLEYKKLYLQLQLALVRPEGSYAWARWTNPTNYEQTTNAVFFTIGPKLVGAFFPLCGFPDLPHELPVNMTMIFEFMNHHWPKVVPMIRSFVERIKPEFRGKAFQEVMRQVRERIQMNQQMQLRINMHVVTNGGTANREALGSFIMQTMTLPTTQQAELAQHVKEVQKRRGDAEKQAQARQQHQQQAMVAAMMSSGSTGGMTGMGNVGGMNMNNMGNMGGMTMGAGMPNVNNMANMMNMGLGMPSMGNMSNMAMGGMQNIGHMGGGIPNMGNVGGMNMNLGNMGGMGGHSGQQ